ncbi:MAG: TRM11 family SAM-dependent methyltransferase, partial [Thermoplasmatota archaeon]
TRARGPAGARVLDPFCGTGGLALECALVGARVLASDLDARMVAGTAQTLAHYEFQSPGFVREGHEGIAKAAEADPRSGTAAPFARPSRPSRTERGRLLAVETRDVGEAPEFVAAHGGPAVEAIVTDPPYGRASTLHREEMGALYDRFFAAAHEALAPGGRLAAVFPSEAHARRGEKWFALEAVHAARVHRSLTRYFCVYRR